MSSGLKSIVPDGGVLELGFGIMEKSWAKPSEGVEFKIVLGEQGSQATLLNEILLRLPGTTEHKSSFKQRIDLSDYAGEQTGYFAYNRIAVGLRKDPLKQKGSGLLVQSRSLFTQNTGSFLEMTRSTTSS